MANNTVVIDVKPNVDSSNLQLLFTYINNAKESLDMMKHSMEGIDGPTLILNERLKTTLMTFDKIRDHASQLKTGVANGTLTDGQRTNMQNRLQQSVDDAYTKMQMLSDSGSLFSMQFAKDFYSSLPSLLAKQAKRSAPQVLAAMRTAFGRGQTFKQTTGDTIDDLMWDKNVARALSAANGMTRGQQKQFLKTLLPQATLTSVLPEYQNRRWGSRLGYAGTDQRSLEDIMPQIYKNAYKSKGYQHIESNDNLFLSGHGAQRLKNLIANNNVALYIARKVGIASYNANGRTMIGLNISKRQMDTYADLLYKEFEKRTSGVFSQSNRFADKETYYKGTDQIVDTIKRRALSGTGNRTLGAMNVVSDLLTDIGPNAKTWRSYSTKVPQADRIVLTDKKLQELYAVDKINFADTSKSRRVAINESFATKMLGMQGRNYEDADMIKLLDLSSYNPLSAKDVETLSRYLKNGLSINGKQYDFNTFHGTGDNFTARFVEREKAALAQKQYAQLAKDLGLTGDNIWNGFVPENTDFGSAKALGKHMLSKNKLWTNGVLIGADLSNKKFALVDFSSLGGKILNSNGIGYVSSDILNSGIQARFGVSGKGSLTPVQGSMTDFFRSIGLEDKNGKIMLPGMNGMFDASGVDGIIDLSLIKNKGAYAGMTSEQANAALTGMIQAQKIRAAALYAFDGDASSLGSQATSYMKLDPRLMVAQSQSMLRRFQLLQTNEGIRKYVFANSLDQLSDLVNDPINGDKEISSNPLVRKRVQAYQEAMVARVLSGEVFNFNDENGSMSIKRLERNPLMAMLMSDTLSDDQRSTMRERVRSVLLNAHGRTFGDELLNDLISLKGGMVDFSNIDQDYIAAIRSPNGFGQFAYGKNYAKTLAPVYKEFNLIEEGLHLSNEDMNTLAGADMDADTAKVVSGLFADSVKLTLDSIPQNIKDMMASGDQSVRAKVQLLAQVEGGYYQDNIGALLQIAKMSKVAPLFMGFASKAGTRLSQVGLNEGSTVPYMLAGALANDVYDLTTTLNKDPKLIERSKSLRQALRLGAQFRLLTTNFLKMYDVKPLNVDASGNAWSFTNQAEDQNIDPNDVVKLSDGRYANVSFLRGRHPESGYAIDRTNGRSYLSDAAIQGAIIGNDLIQNGYGVNGFGSDLRLILLSDKLGYGDAGLATRRLMKNNRHLLVQEAALLRFTLSDELKSVLGSQLAAAYEEIDKETNDYFAKHSVDGLVEDENGQLVNRKTYASRRRAKFGLNQAQLRVGNYFDPLIGMLIGISATDLHIRLRYGDDVANKLQNSEHARLIDTTRGTYSPLYAKYARVGASPFVASLQPIQTSAVPNTASNVQQNNTTNNPFLPTEELISNANMKQLTSMFSNVLLQKSVMAELERRVSSFSSDMWKPFNLNILRTPALKFFGLANFNKKEIGDLARWLQDNTLIDAANKSHILLRVDNANIGYWNGTRAWVSNNADKTILALRKGVQSTGLFDGQIKDILNYDNAIKNLQSSLLEFQKTRQEWFDKNKSYSKEDQDLINKLQSQIGLAGSLKQQKIAMLQLQNATYFNDKLIEAELAITGKVGSIKLKADIQVEKARQNVLNQQKNLLLAYKQGLVTDDVYNQDSVRQNNLLDYINNQYGNDLTAKSLKSLETLLDRISNKQIKDPFSAIKDSAEQTKERLVQIKKDLIELNADQSKIDKADKALGVIDLNTRFAILQEKLRQRQLNHSVLSPFTGFSNADYVSALLYSQSKAAALLNLNQRQQILKLKAKRGDTFLTDELQRIVNYSNAQAGKDFDTNYFDNAIQPFMSGSERQAIQAQKMVQNAKKVANGINQSSLSEEQKQNRLNQLSYFLDPDYANRLNQKYSDNLMANADASFMRNAQAYRSIYANNAITNIDSRRQNAVMQLSMQRSGMINQQLQLRQELSRYGKFENGRFSANESSQLPQNIQDMASKYNNLTQAIQQNQQATNELNTIQGTLSLSLTNVGNSMINMFAQTVSQAFNKALQSARQFVSEYDSYMNEIQMVTFKSDEATALLGDKLIDKAVKLKASVKDVATIATALYRQGLNDQQVDERLDDIVMFTKTAKVSAADATKLITVAFNSGMVDSASQAMDVITALGDSAATTAALITKGLQKSISSAKEVGVTYEELVSMLTVITSKTQLSGTTAGTALNTFFSRISKVGTNELEYDENGNAISGSDLSTILASVGVDTYRNGKRVDPYDVFEQLAEQWDTFDDARKSQISYALGGTRQYSNLSALISGFAERDENGLTAISKYRRIAEGSEGSTAEKYGVWQESYEAAQSNYQNAIANLTESFTGLTPAITGILDAVSGLINGFALLNESTSGVLGIVTAAVPIVSALGTTFTALAGTLGTIAGLGGLGAGLGGLGGLLTTIAPWLGAAALGVGAIAGVAGAVNAANQPQLISFELRNIEAQNIRSLIDEANQINAKRLQDGTLSQLDAKRAYQIVDQLNNLGILGVSVSFDDVKNSALALSNALSNAAKLQENKTKNDIFEDLQSFNDGFDKYESSVTSRSMMSNNNTNAMVKLYLHSNGSFEDADMFNFAAPLIDSFFELIIKSGYVGLDNQVVTVPNGLGTKQTSFGSLSDKNKKKFLMQRGYGNKDNNAFFDLFERLLLGENIDENLLDDISPWDYVKDGLESRMLSYGVGTNDILGLMDALRTNFENYFSLNEFSEQTYKDWRTALSLINGQVAGLLGVYQNVGYTPKDTSAANKRSFFGNANLTYAASKQNTTAYDNAFKLLNNVVNKGINPVDIIQGLQNGYANNNLDWLSVISADLDLAPYLQGLGTFDEDGNFIANPNAKMLQIQALMNAIGAKSSNFKNATYQTNTRRSDQLIKDFNAMNDAMLNNTALQAWALLTSSKGLTQQRQNDLKTALGEDLYNQWSNGELSQGSLDYISGMLSNHRYNGNVLNAKDMQSRAATLMGLLFSGMFDESKWTQQLLAELFGNVDGLLGYYNAVRNNDQLAADYYKGIALTGIKIAGISDGKYQLQTQTLIKALSSTATFEDKMNAINSTIAAQNQIGQANDAFSRMQSGKAGTNDYSVVASYLGIDLKTLKSMQSNSKGKSLISKLMQDKQNEILEGIKKSVEGAIPTDVLSGLNGKNLTTDELVDSLTGKVEDAVIDYIKSSRISVEGGEIVVPADAMDLASDGDLANNTIRQMQMEDAANNYMNLALANNGFGSIRDQFTEEGSIYGGADSYLKAMSDPTIALMLRLRSEEGYTSLNGGFTNQMTELQQLAMLSAMQYGPYGLNQTGYYNAVGQMFGMSGFENGVNNALQGLYSGDTTSLFGLNQEQAKGIFSDTALMSSFQQEFGNISGMVDALKLLAQQGKVSTTTMRLLANSLAQMRFLLMGYDALRAAKALLAFKAGTSGSKRLLAQYTGELTEMAQSLNLIEDAISAGSNRTDKQWNLLSNLTGGTDVDKLKTGLFEAVIQEAFDEMLGDYQAQAAAFLDAISQPLDGAMVQMGETGYDITSLLMMIPNMQGDIAAAIINAIGLTNIQGWLQARLNPDGTFNANIAGLSVGGGGGGSGRGTSTRPKSGGGGGGGGGGQKAASAAKQLSEKISYANKLYQNAYSLNLTAMSYYLSTGQLTMYDKAINNAIKLDKAYAKQVEDNIAQLKKQREGLVAGTDDWKTLTDTLHTNQQLLAKVNARIALNTKKQKLNQEAIRQTFIELQQTVDELIKARIESLRDQLAGRVSMEETILNAIKDRYQDEWDLIKEDIDKKKEALNELKSLIGERLNMRKEAADEAKKYEELAELQSQLASILADTTRSKEARQLRERISALQELISWDIAEDQANALQERIQSLIDAYDEYISEGDKYLEAYLADANNMASLVNSVMQLGQDDLIAWLKANDKTYQLSLQDTQKQMVQGWLDTFKQMKGIIDTYWAQVNLILKNKDSFIEYMKQSQLYLNAPKTQRESMVYQWLTQYDDWKKANSTTDTSFLYNINSVLNDIYSVLRDIQNGDWSGINGNSGGGGGGGGGGSTAKSTYDVQLYDAKTGLFKMTKTFSSQEAADSYKKLANSSVNIRAYATGGVADLTGLAWIDGTKTKPERVLSANQTALFDNMVSSLLALNSKGINFDFLKDIVEWSDNIKYKPTMSNIDTESNSGNVANIGDVYVTLNEAEFNNDSDYELIALKVGLNFAKQLSKQGLHLASYAF